MKRNLSSTRDSEPPCERSLGYMNVCFFMFYIECNILLHLLIYASVRGLCNMIMVFDMSVSFLCVTNILNAINEGFRLEFRSFISDEK